MNTVFGPTADFQFRSPVIAPEKTIGTTRIWLASASYGEDRSLPPDVIFPHLIQTELSTAGVRAQVLNAARAGSRIPSNVRDLNDGFDRWQPDIVVLYQMSLDLNYLSKRHGGAEPVPSRDNTDDRVAANQPAPAVAPTWASRLVEQTTVYQLLHGNVTARLVGMRLLPDRLAPAARAEFRKMLEDLIREVQARGAEPVLCTFATNRPAGDTTAVPADIERSIYRWNEALSAKGWLDAVDDFNHVIREVAHDKDLRLIDVAADISGREELFRDPVHFTREGHRAVAAAIAAALAGRSAMPAAGSSPIR